MILEPVLNGSLQPILRSVFDSGTGFSPSSVFTGGQAGLWLDESDASTGFQDSTGQTPQTASGQVTGLRLDKRLPSVFHQVADLTAYSRTNVGNAATTFAISGNTITITAASLSDEVDIGGAGFFSAAERARTEIIVTASGSGTLLVYAGATPRSIVLTGTPTRYICSNVNTASGFFSVVAGTGGMSAVVVVNSATGYPGNHVLQAAASARPEYDLISGIASDFFDGIDDKYATGTFVAGTLTASMDAFIAIRRGDATSGEIVGSANGDYFGFYASGSASGATFGCGAPTGLVNGVALPGTTAGDLHTALTAGQWKVLEYQGLDLSDWTDARISEVDLITADIGGVIVCPAQSAGMRTQLRQWLGRKVGLSL